MRKLNNTKKLKDDTIMKILLYSACALFILIFVNFMYEDIQITSQHGFSFIDLLFKGNISKFYEANFNNGIGRFGWAFVAYDFQIVSIISIWNFPLYLIYRIFESPAYIFETLWINSLASLLWIKSILIIFLGGTIVVFYKISKMFEDKIDKKLLTFLYISSPIIMMVIAFFGGYDIIGIFFSILGVYYYLKNKKTKFLLCFTLAISLKLFALFIFIPLILLKEKKFFSIIQNLGFGFFFTLLGKILFYNAPGYLKSISGFNDMMFERLSASFISGGYGNISIFFVILFIIFIYCYIKKVNDNDLKYYVLYICCLVYSAFCVFILCHPQWLILQSVFMIIIIFLNKKQFKNNLILSIGSSIGFLAIMANKYGIVFCTDSLEFMLFNKIVSRPTALNDIAVFIALEKFIPIIYALTLSCLIVFFVINFPSKWNKNERKKKLIKDNEIKFLLIFRMLITPLLCIILLYYYLI